LEPDGLQWTIEHALAVTFFCRTATLSALFVQDHQDIETPEKRVSPLEESEWS
jgi:hypothetical protein